MKRCCQRLVATGMIVVSALLAGAALAGEPPQMSGPGSSGKPSASEPQLKLMVGGGTATLEFVETPLQEVVDCINRLHELKNHPPQSPAFLVRGTPSAWETKLEKALDEATTLEFIETPLQCVVEYLEDLHSIEIQLDKPALEGVGIGTDTPVTRNLKGISLRSVLRLMLSELELTYVLRDEVLLITTPAAVCENPVTRVYCVAALLDFDESAHRLADKLGLVFQPADDKTTRLRILPHRQTLIVQGDLQQHEALEWLLGCLRHATGPRKRTQAATCPANSANVDRFERTIRPPAESKIEAALRDTTTLEFIETPLQDVVDYLKDLHSIEIQIDTRALEDMGIGSDNPITMSLNGVSLRAALRLMLRPLDLTYVIRDEVLLIVPDDVPEGTDIRVYSVAELLCFGEPSDELAKMLVIALARQETPSVAVPDGEEKKNESPPKLRIVPYRQAVVVLANSEEHEALVRLLHELSLSLQGKTTSPVCPERASADRAERTQQRSRKARSRRRNRSANKSNDDKKTPNRDRGKDPSAGPAKGPSKRDPTKDPFADGATQENDPFGKKPTKKEDPFGGGSDDEDPFGGGGGGPDPFGGGGGAGDEDPFGGGEKEKEEDPFGG